MEPVSLRVITTAPGVFWLELPIGVTSVGRVRFDAVSPQLVVPDATLARRHFKIVASADDVLDLYDVASTGGTFLNDHERILTGRPRRLVEGDRIYLGAPSSSAKAFVRFRPPPTI